MYIMIPARFSRLGSDVVLYLPDCLADLTQRLEL